MFHTAIAGSLTKPAWLAETQKLWPQWKAWGVEALDRAAMGLTCTTAVHICYGHGIEANIDWKNSLGEEAKLVDARQAAK